MPTALALPGATGSGFLAYTSGAQLVTDIDVIVTAVGPSVHLFPTGPCFRVQHVGWIAVGSSVGIPPGGIGMPTFDPWWFEWIDFVTEDKQLVNKLTFPSDAFCWNLTVGATVTFSVNY